MVTTYIQPILFITGVITAMAVMVFVVPRRAMKLVFNVERPDLAILLMTRHWGLLIGLVGMLLVYAAYEPTIRSAAMTMAATEKIAGVVLIVLTPMKRTVVMRMIVFGDGAMAIIYLMYFMGL